MSRNPAQLVRTAISELLVEAGQSPDFDDDESLFDSGKLDSLAAVKLLTILEGELGVDLSDPDFEVEEIDTFAAIMALASEQATA
ncbi:MAG: phosphopantetheine-binding protein [Hoeflea sp.]|uniref:phosphopantetheine-binding protein n=1 Tax=Hoeflea sp. TaxID=1940281 RepID=UPI0032EB261C